MCKIKNLLPIILFLAVAPVTVADNHGTIENRPVETWMCSFNEGQTMADLDEWYVAFNEHAETMQNNSFNSFVWVPTFVSDLKAADVALTFSFPTLTEMGTTMDEFFGSEGGAELFQQYQEVLDCAGREVWTVTQKRAAE